MLQTSITEEMIKNLVHGFYFKIQNDAFIGPIFKERITDHWDQHLQTMCDFWSGLTLGTHRFRGRPLGKHLGIPRLGEEHFNRWLELFKETAFEVCPPNEAIIFVDFSTRIAENFLHNIKLYQNMNSNYDRETKVSSEDNHEERIKT